MGIDSNKIQIEEKKGYEPSGVTEQLENKYQDGRIKRRGGHPCFSEEKHCDQAP